MLWNTYEKVTKLFEAANGYLSASELRREKITTVQIRELIEKGTLERVSHGYYWFRGENNRKPENYEMIEACMVNQHAVICADSVCYYLGLTPYKPRKLSVATLKTDRSKMSLNFPVTRHYFSDLAFEQDVLEENTPYGKMRYYSLERSVCDVIRFREDIEKKEVDIILKHYLQTECKGMKKLLDYADAMRVGKIVRSMFEDASK